MTTSVTWTGADGSVWNLDSGAQGVCLAQGFGGLHLPSFKQQVAQSARVPGQRYLGTTYEPRDVTFSVIVGDPAGATTGAVWQALDAAWWASLSAENTGTLTVTTDGSGQRSLTCRLVAASDPSFAVDPSMAGMAQYALTLEADQPFWVGPQISPPPLQMPTVTQPYYGGSGGTGFGPPFYISPASAMANAVIDNPGDRAAYTVWTVTGPGTPTLSINGHTTTLPTLFAGQTVQIDTNPLTPNAVRDITSGGSVDFWPYMGAHDFWVPVPARSVGYAIPMSVTGGVPGQTQIQVSLTPLFNRAW